MKTNFRRVLLRTVAGFKKAERLQGEGWQILLVGWDYVLLEKKEVTR